MTWYAPNTAWTTGTLVSASELNEIGEDLLDLLRGRVSTVNGGGTEFTTVSTSYVDITGMSVSHTVAQSSANLLILAAGDMLITGAYVATLAVNVGGTDYDMGAAASVSAYTQLQTYFTRVTGLSAGTYTVKLRLKTSNASGTAYFGANSSATYRKLYVIETL